MTDADLIPRIRELAVRLGQGETPRERYRIAVDLLTAASQLADIYADGERVAGQTVGEQDGGQR